MACSGVAHIHPHSMNGRSRGSQGSRVETWLGQGVKTAKSARLKGQGTFWAVKIFDRSRSCEYGTRIGVTTPCGSMGNHAEVYYQVT